MEKIFMKLLMENWRKFINEETLSEGPKGFDDLPEDFKVVVSPSKIKSGYHIKLKKGNVTFAYGDILTMDRRYSPWCHNNNVFMSRNTNAEKGWGPFVYDIMIEYATLKGGGLTPDKEGGHLSPDSEHVWETYFNNRKGAIAGDNLEIVPIPADPHDGCDRTGLWGVDDLEREYGENYNDCHDECEYGEEERNPKVYTDPLVAHSKEYDDCAWDCENEYGDEAMQAAKEDLYDELSPMTHMVYRKAPTVIKTLGERFIDQT